MLLLCALGAAGWFTWTRPEPGPAPRVVSHVLVPDAPVPRPAPPDAPPQEADEPPVAPRVQPGKAITVTLSEAPAAAYLSGERTENDTFYQRLVEEVGRGRAVYDPDLGRAAREFVFQFTELGVEPPSDVREFLATATGAIAGDTVFQHVRTSSEAEAALRKAIGLVIDHPPTGPGPLHIGVGEIFQPGLAMSRHIGVVGTPLPFDLVPMPRQVQPGQSIHIAGRIRGRWTDLHALVLRPDGRSESLTPQIRGDQLTIDIVAGTQVGALDVQFVGDGPEGPGKLAQVRVEVGREPPRSFTTRLAPDEKNLRTADDAAHYTLQLLNSDRARFGLPALQWDGQLAAIGRDHSAEMRDSGFFAHRSPTTGMHTDRLQKAHYRSVASAENLAHNASVWEAEVGLMHSLGHRRNILDPMVTHVGVGVAGKDDEEGNRRWWITQLFSKPVTAIDPNTEVARVRALIDDRRQAGGQEALALDAALSTVAQAAADAALGGEVQGASGQALELAKQRGLLRGKLRAWTALVPDLSQLQLPATVDAASARRLGVAVAQDAQSDDGRIAVVLLLAD